MATTAAEGDCVALPMSVSTSISAAVRHRRGSRAAGGRERRAHLGLSSLAAAHLTAVPELKAALKKQGATTS